MSMQEMNEALVAEFNRLGQKREPIDAAIKANGATSISDLKPELYQKVLDEVRAVAVAS